MKDQEATDWVPSVYYAESLVNCSLEKAWKILLDYEAWNPTFIDAKVTRVKGQASSEGEVVEIKKSLSDVKGEPLPDFYADTVKVVPKQHIVWYVHPKEGDTFRNFVDFGLTEVPSGVRFNIYYYEQNKLSGDLLRQQRQNNEAGFRTLAAAFKSYCESH